VTLDSLFLGGTETISTDLVRLSCILLPGAHFSMLAIIDAHESALHAGIIRYVSSPNLSIQLPGVVMIGQRDYDCFVIVTITMCLM